MLKQIKSNRKCWAHLNDFKTFFLHFELLLRKGNLPEQTNNNSQKV